MKATKGIARTLHPQYRHNRACPHCGSALARLGYWMPDGTWRDEAVCARGPRKARPDHRPEVWHNYPKRVWKDDRSGGRYEEVPQWYHVVHYECVTWKETDVWHGGCGVFADLDTKEYAGDILPHMELEMMPQAEGLKMLRTRVGTLFGRLT